MAIVCPRAEALTHANERQPSVLTTARPSHDLISAQDGRVTAPLPSGVPSGRGRRRLLTRAAAVELAVLVLLFVAYNIVRALSATTSSVAIQHTHQLLSLEGPLFDHLERPLNHWLEAMPVLAVLACYYYAALHYLATPAVLLTTRRRGGWAYWRGYSTLVLASALALIGYALFPAAPPRLVPDLGIVDVLRSYADYGWWGSAASAPRGIGDATNQYAAIPSMHFGWALWCGLQMWNFKSRAWRVLAVAYPSILVVVVLGTGNHLLIDVLAGAACVIIAYALVELAHRIYLRQNQSNKPQAAAKPHLRPIPPELDHETGRAAKLAS